MKSVLIVDDDAAVGTVLGALLRQAGFASHHERSGEAALAALERRAFDAAITDVRMPGIDGLALLARLRRGWPELPVIMLTAHGTVGLAVEAMKAGAADFVQKPFDREELLFVVRKALAGGRRAAEAAPEPPEPPGAARELVGEGEAMREVRALVDRAARSTATVLVLGESGTGKGLVAQAIHEQSARRGKPFVRLHCGALPDGLLESELFGYEKGAFTGAVGRKPGRVELAEGGTLFLDEIGDVTPAMQVKLLRVLQEREYERLGGSQTLKADVRFVAATHRDLGAMAARGEFREDLYYRLNVIPLTIPPLRARPEDITALALGFARAHGPGVTLAPDALALLAAQRWPGNVRQLQNFVERLVVLSDGPAIGRADVERELARKTGLAPPEPDAPAGPARLDASVREAEKLALKNALDKAGGNRTLAARLLGVSRRTLYNKLDEYDVG
ncbi:MAG TPA: sigma-54 dependent transcriptional regulator [Polyangiaceae bacterium]|nr:sigma-54 dependent transcriptional regulator [Polyangiaceae bacterium]